MDALTPVLINIDECAENTRIIADPGSSQDAVLRAVRYNNAVDSHFFTCKFVAFMHQVMHVHALSRSTMVTILYGTRDCSNAFYYGDGVLMIGAGVASDYPYGTIDLIAHEFGHGLVSNYTPQRGEAGALQEHFADVVATSFESYVCKTHPQLPIVFDYLIGEDRDPRSVIRNMAEPWRQRNPRAYGGRFWRASTIICLFLNVILL
jgi:Zn-dependent metalloprotease